MAATDEAAIGLDKDFAKATFFLLPARKKKSQLKPSVSAIDIEMNITLNLPRGIAVMASFSILRKNRELGVIKTVHEI
jgi:hypothetical protein